MTAKDDALNALDQARKMLEAKEPMTGLRLSLLFATLDHAANCLGYVQEVKRKRKEKKP